MFSKFDIDIEDTVQEEINEYISIYDSPFLDDDIDDLIAERSKE